MATRASASAVFPIPVDNVWKVVRDFTWPARHMSHLIEYCKIVDGNSPFEIGAVREIKWKTGEKRKQRLIELSDQYRRVTWETIEADPPGETSAAITTIRLFRITETNATLVECSDVSGSLIKFEQKAYQDNLAELRKSLMSA